MKYITMLFTADGAHLVHDICVNPHKRPFHEAWQVRLWNLRERRKIAEHPGTLVGVTLDGQGILTQFGYGVEEFRAYDTHTGAVIERSSLATASFQFNQRYMLRTHAKDDSLAFIDGLGVDTPREIPFKGNPDLHELVLSPDGKRFVALYMFDVAGFDGAWGSCSDIDGKLLFKFKEVNRFASPPLVVFAEHHPLLSVEATQGTMMIYDIIQGTVTDNLHFHPLAGEFVAFSLQSPPLIAYHCKTKTWRLIKGSKAKDIKETGKVSGGTFSQDGERFAVLFDDGHIRIYRVQDLAVEMVLGQQ